MGGWGMVVKKDRASREEGTKEGRKEGREERIEKCKAVEEE